MLLKQTTLSFSEYTSLYDIIVPKDNLLRKINDLIDLDLDVISYIAPDATVNVIRDSVRVEKKTLTPPKQLVNVIKCPNPHCICNNENIDHIFKLTDAHPTYRCIYCETKSN